VGGTCSANGNDHRCIQILLGKSEGKKPLEYKDIDGMMIKTNVKE